MHSRGRSHGLSHHMLLQEPVYWSASLRCGKFSHRSKKSYDSCFRFRCSSYSEILRWSTGTRSTLYLRFSMARSRSHGRLRSNPKHNLHSLWVCAEAPAHIAYAFMVQAASYAFEKVQARLCICRFVFRCATRASHSNLLHLKDLQQELCRTGWDPGPNMMHLFAEIGWSRALGH